MRILVFGATGSMGILLVREALTAFRSCTIILYVRSPEKLPVDITSDPAIIVIVGQLDDDESLSMAMEGVTAVLTALGPTGRKGLFYPSGTPISLAYSRIIEMMRRNGVKRLVALTTPSVADPEDQFDFPLIFLKNAFALVSRNASKDIINIGKTIRTEGADLDWTMVRVAFHSRPSEGSQSGVTAGYLGDGKSGIFSSKEGVAGFAVAELQKGDWIRKAPLLSSSR